jgi:hypothetical protein
MTEIDFELAQFGDALVRAARRDVTSRFGPTRRRRTLTVATIALALVGASAAVAATMLAGGGQIEHGKLVLPAPVATQIARLNGALDACYIANGATRVDLGGGAFTYNDPQGAAQTACQPQQDAVTAFADGPEMQAATTAAAPLLKAFWGCMRQSGALSDDRSQAAKNLHSAAFLAQEDACSSSANAAVAQGS